MRSEIENYVGSDAEDEPFRAFLRWADKCCVERFGVGIFDLVDMPWRDFYEDQVFENSISEEELFEFMMEHDDLLSTEFD